MSLAVLVAAALVAGAAGAVLGRMTARRRAAMAAAAARRVVEALKTAAAAERDAVVRSAVVEAREQAQAEAVRAEQQQRSRHEQLAVAAAKTTDREEQLRRRAADLEASRDAGRQRMARVQQLEADAKASQQETIRLREETIAALARAAGENVAELRAGIRDAEIEEARAQAAQLVRGVDQALAEPEQGRRAKRLMGISVGRFSGHYLTERQMSTVMLPPGTAGDAVIGKDEANLRAIERAANVKLVLSDERDAVRLEGLDGVAREVARRSLAWLMRGSRAVEPEQMEKTARDIAASVEGEVMEFGRRAFRTLDLRLPHAELIKLVGRLNFRTSYTQNQWKHAVECAFLCGMMAEELGLDVALARRAAVLHDIGKALTHEVDGSHALIGAELARKHGEPELVVNAIGAHHGDQPPAGALAYLVAAADAMSGARPGARRMMEESYVTKISDLERISRSFRGVDEAYAVHGGREVRVYVQEDRVDDRAAADMAAEMAKRISRDMTFPGQIRVTVIREYVAEEMAS